MDRRKEKYYENILFDFKTTYKTDYRSGLTTSFGTCKPPQKKILPKPPGHCKLKDLHTMTETKLPKSLDFTLFHHPRPIIDTDPRKITMEKLHEPTTDIVKVRCLRVFPPALNIEELDPVSRDKFLNYIYYKPRPFMEKRDEVYTPPARPDVIRLRKVDELYVSKEWRDKLIGWDDKQMRAYVDQDREFWTDFNAKLKQK